MKTKYFVSLVLCVSLLAAILLVALTQAQTSPANGGASSKRFVFGKAVLAQIEGKHSKDGKNWIAFSVSGLPTIEIHNWDELAAADQQAIRTALTSAAWAEE